MVIALNKLSKTYGAVRALAGVSGELDGRIIGLLGPNGAGKSTLLKCLLGLIEFDGDAVVLGHSPRTESLAIRERVGYMPEQDSYLAGMTAVELCTLAAELSGLPHSEARQRAHAALYYANLEDKRYLKVETYSTGMKQRVKLAQALVHDPDLLFLDEPTNGLDPGGRQEMLELIRRLPDKRQCTVILSTHLLPDVEKICDRVAVMHAGELRFFGTIDALRQRRSGPAPVFEVEVKDGADELSRAVEALGCAVERTGARLVIALREGQDSLDIMRAARGAGVQIRHLAPQRESLEQSFLRIIGATAEARP